MYTGMYTCTKTLSYRLSCPQISNVERRYFLPTQGLSDINGQCARRPCAAISRASNATFCDRWTHRKCTLYNDLEVQTTGKTQTILFIVIPKKWDFQTFPIHILKATEPPAPFHNNMISLYIVHLHQGPGIWIRVISLWTVTLSV